MKRCIGIAALALALALTAGCGDDDGDGAGGSGGNGGNGGGGGNECPALERTGTLAGSCVQAGLGCYETRGAMAVQIAAQNQDVCETTGGSWVTEPCPAAAGGACAQATAAGYTTVYTWTDITAAEVRDYCDDFPCGTYVAP